MDYPLENLSPEKFQLLCQSLLIKENPGLLCFPIAQPDGGRDAVQPLIHTGKSKDFSVFQIKFVRRPQAEPDPHKWLIKTINGELPKIKEMIPKGAKSFTLLTNIDGTAHPDVGSIDNINDQLSKTLEIPAFCLWRNDINRRLDSSWDIKWSFPEIMTGPDLIRYIIEANLTEASHRRSSTIRAFVTHQHSLDKDVKFKQIDLDNRLLDFFIDVPIRIPNNLEGNGDRRKVWHHSLDDEDTAYYDPRNMQARRRRPIGAATFILNKITLEKRFHTLVLEGAPGQGKSTITQYICQVHRIRLLEKDDELQRLDASHAISPVKLPIKIDLRDYSLWLSKRNPFNAEAEKVLSDNWAKTLESFIVALINNQSGGSDFNLADLHAVLRVSATLLVLDGLDEVADIQRRKEIVNEIDKGVIRLRSISASLQVIVTSRPAAFENSPGLPEETFTYVSLDHVTKELVDEYSSKWLRARKVDPRESAVIRRLIDEKISQPHLRDLTRNTMQLAIFLSLIHTRGTSLPDKRTALYDSYIELFFNRESEKSTTVRDNRDLLIDIHRYLAWVLHTEAEGDGVSKGGRGSGAIEESRLRKLLRDYLVAEGHETALLDSLFTGVIERVVALVSRVQGTYEFEVQPLREYFAARYLYENAPYSPTGNEKKGSKPDRFDAISRNFYWMNVTRFYAGCYSKGELPSLVNSIRDLIDDSHYKNLSHPRVLGSILLRDWVFNQSPRSVSDVIRLILDGIGLRFLLATSSRRLSNWQPIILPDGCGRKELVSICFGILSENPPYDYAHDVLDVLAANAKKDELYQLWRSAAIDALDSQRKLWITRGLHLGCLPRATHSDLDTIFTSETQHGDAVIALLYAHLGGYIEARKTLLNKSVEAILAYEIKFPINFRDPSELAAFARLVTPVRYAVAFENNSPASISEVFKRTYQFNDDNKPTASALIPGEIGRKIRSTIQIALDVSTVPASQWASSIDPWETLSQAILENFEGEPWLVKAIACYSSAIKSHEERCLGFDNLFDNTKSVCRRARYARLRSGSHSWWRSTLDSISNEGDAAFAVSIYFLWASPATILATLPHAEKALLSLSNETWARVFELVEGISNRVKTSEDRMNGDVSDNLTLSPRACALLSFRPAFSKSWTLTELIVQHNECAHLDTRIFQAFQERVIARMLEQPSNYQKYLRFISNAYFSGVLSSPFRIHSRDIISEKMTEDIASEVISNAKNFPGHLVAAAELYFRKKIEPLIRPVSLVAKTDGWFDGLNSAD